MHKIHMAVCVDNTFDLLPSNRITQPFGSLALGRIRRIIVRTLSFNTVEVFDWEWGQKVSVRSGIGLLRQGLTDSLYIGSPDTNNQSQDYRPKNG